MFIPVARVVLEKLDRLQVLIWGGERHNFIGQFANKLACWGTGGDGRKNQK